MNTEELKMILDAVSAVSGDAKSVLIWYFVGKFGVSVLQILAFCGGAITAVWMITRTVLAVDNAERRGREVCDYLGISYYGSSAADIIKVIELRAKGGGK